MLNIILCNILKSILFFSFISFNVIDFFKTHKLIRPFYEMIKLEEYLRRCIKNSYIIQKGKQTKIFYYYPNFE